MRITRRELYELVSLSPLSKVAPGLGISSTTLASICKDHDVPYPGSGYWTRKYLGRTVSPEPLPTATLSNEGAIDIEPKKVRSPRLSVRMADPIAKATGSLGRIGAADEVSARVGQLIKPHPIIAKWLVDHERCRREAKASRDPWRVDMAPAPLTDIDHRRHKILGRLFHSLEDRGGQLSETEKGLIRVTIDRENIDFQIRERKRQVSLSQRSTQNSHNSRDLVGTGKLVFAIRTYLRGPHNEEWSETDSSPLESQLPQIIERLFEGAKILEAWHIEIEQEREKQRQEAARRAERARLVKQEESRRQMLAELARNWQAANLIRDFIAALKSKPFDADQNVGGTSLAEWFAWGDAAAAALDVTRDGPEGLFSIISDVKID